MSNIRNVTDPEGVQQLSQQASLAVRRDNEQEYATLQILAFAHRIEQLASRGTALTEEQDYRLTAAITRIRRIQNRANR